MRPRDLLLILSALAEIQRKLPSVSATQLDSRIKELETECAQDSALKLDYVGSEDERNRTD